MFSVSLNPPQNESVRLDVFEQALEAIEERNSLIGQPRVVIFHARKGGVTAMPSGPALVPMR